MYTLLEMANRVSNRIQKSDTSFQSHIKEWIDYRYGLIWRRHLWKESIRAKESGITFTSGEAFLVLDKDIDEILFLTERANDKTLFNTDAATMFKTFADIIDTQDKPIGYAFAGEIGFKANVAAAETIDVLSSSSSDTTQTVRIWFLVSGEEVTELLTLTGTSAVTSTNTADINGFLRASKSANTVGVITVEGTTSKTDFIVMAPEEFTTYYKRVRLRQVPNAADTLSVWYKKRRVRLVNDQDIPEFDCSEALIAGAYADAWKEQKQYSKAQLEEQRFEALVNDLMLKSLNQGENIELAQPHIEISQLGANITDTS